jgi:hypothetical protein
VQCGTDKILPFEPRRVVWYPRDNTKLPFTALAGVLINSMNVLSIWMGNSFDEILTNTEYSVYSMPQDRIYAILPPLLLLEPTDELKLRRFRT